MQDEPTVKVLVVEDDIDVAQRYQGNLRHDAAVLIGETISQAEIHFRNNPDLSPIIMDACVPGEDINTLPLLELIRKTFPGPIIAASNSEYYNEKLLENGCDHMATKKTAGRIALDILRNRKQ